MQPQWVTDQMADKCKGTLDYSVNRCGGTKPVSVKRLLNMKIRSCWVMVIAVGLISGCSHVSLTQRGTLAKDEMQWESDPSIAALAEHAYTSKEAASGGRAIGGGGCGCK